MRTRNTVPSSARNTSGKSLFALLLLMSSNQDVTISSLVFVSIARSSCFLRECNTAASSSSLNEFVALAVSGLSPPAGYSDRTLTAVALAHALRKARCVSRTISASTRCSKSFGKRRPFILNPRENQLGACVTEGKLATTFTPCPWHPGGPKTSRLPHPWR